MATYRTNMTFMSRSITKLVSKSNTCGLIHHQNVLPKHYHSGPVMNSVRIKPHRHKQHTLMMYAVRHASTDTPYLPPGYIPDVPSAPLEEVATVLPELNALGEPTLQSLGLGGYSPPGLIQQLLELVHVSADIPWWAAIAAGAFTIRLVLFPLMVYNRKAQIHVRNHMPTVVRLQQKISDSRTMGDNLELSRRSMELTSYTERNNVKIYKMFLTPIVQVPVLFSAYFGIKGMTQLPLESMKTGGIGWITDLTVPDPYLILPGITAATLFVMFELGAESQKASDLSHVMKWVTRCLPAVVFFFCSKFAAGVVCYWSVSNLISLVTLAILKSDKAKKFFKMPTEVIQKKSVREKKGFTQGFTDMWETNKLTQEIVHRRQVDDTTFKKAGVGPVPKTYRYNPVKAQKKASG